DPERAIRYRDLADRTLERGAILLARAPRSAGHWLAVAEAALRGPIQVAVVVGEDDSAAGLLAAARQVAPGGSVIVSGEQNSEPLLAERPSVGGKSAAYVCRGSVCDLPVTTPEELRSGLRRV
ncbi:hypothetical protein ACW9HQ_39415, partial [Nocardia gipuzkoensis]